MTFTRFRVLLINLLVSTTLFTSILIISLLIPSVSPMMSSSTIVQAVQHNINSFIENSSYIELYKDFNKNSSLNLYLIIKNCIFLYYKSTNKVNIITEVYIYKNDGSSNPIEVTISKTYTNSNFANQNIIKTKLYSDRNDKKFNITNLPKIVAQFNSNILLYGVSASLFDRYSLEPVLENIGDYLGIRASREDIAIFIEANPNIIQYNLQSIKINFIRNNIKKLYIIIINEKYRLKDQYNRTYIPYVTYDNTSDFSARINLYIFNYNILSFVKNITNSLDIILLFLFLFILFRYSISIDVKWSEKPKELLSIYLPVELVYISLTLGMWQMSSSSGTTNLLGVIFRSRMITLFTVLATFFTTYGVSKSISLIIFKFNNLNEVKNYLLLLYFLLALVPITIILISSKNLLPIESNVILSTISIDLNLISLIIIYFIFDLIKFYFRFKILDP